MSKSDKSKNSNICILIINMESITLEETAEKIRSSCYWEKLEGVGRCGHFVTCNILTKLCACNTLTK